MRFQGQVEFLDALYRFQWEGTFHCLADTRVNMLERIFLFRQFLFPGTVIDGADYAHIKGNAVGADSFAFKPCVIEHHGVAVYLAQKNVLPITELHKTG